MTTLALTLPEIGKPDKTEDVKLNTALTAIQTWGNGNIEGTNMTAATAREAGVNRGSNILKAATNIATEQATSSSSFTTLTTADEATVTLPENGLILVWYQAAWKETALNAARAAIFIGATQLKGVYGSNESPIVLEATGQGTNTFTTLASYTNGLISSELSTGYTGDVTTGQVVGTVNSGVNFGGACSVFAAAGTYAVSVKYKTSSGEVIAKGRKLWVEAKAF